MRRVRYMTASDLRRELARLAKSFNSRDDDDEGMAGSPGEWMVERMGEIETELKRRGLEP